jgi:uncharacterized protein YlxW (UPF0749 family)
MTSRPRVDVSTALLNDLLNNTLDPGYRAAADRKRVSHWWDGPLVWIGCVAVGLLLVIAYQQSHLSAPARDAARRDLINRIDAAQSNADGLQSEAKQLTAEVAKLRDAQLPGGNSSGLTAAEVAAGSVAVTGQGMQVQLGDPSSAPSSGTGRPGTTPQSDVSVLHDTDVRAVVNQLWSDGAEAIAINGLRLTPTSFIRVAGESILVDFQPISSPYTIAAIGNSDDLQVGFAQSAVARRLKTLAAVDGITFKFGGKSKQTLPSVTVGQPQYAQLGAKSVSPPSVGTSSASRPAGGSPPGSTSTSPSPPTPTATESR